MDNFLGFIKNSTNPVIADGAMGTMLMQYGLGAGECPESVNLSRPAILEKIHSEYKKAGALLWQTNTFGANRLKLAKYDLAGKLKEIVGEGVKIAREVAAGEAWIGLSVGPTGEFLRPFGKLSFEKAYQIFEEQISYGIEAGADIVCIETMGDLGELKAAYLAAKNFNVPVSCSMSFQAGGRSLMGTDAETFARTLQLWGTDILTTNCTSPQQMFDFLNIFIKNSNLPCYLRPNAGQPVFREGKTVYDMTPDEFTNWCKKFVKEGADIVGGCCGTGPEYIEAMINKLASLEVPEKKIISGRWLTSAVMSVAVREEFQEFEIIANKFIQKGRLDEEKLISEARDYIHKECQVLTLNMTGVNTGDISFVVEKIQSFLRCPLTFKCDDKNILENCLRPYRGIAGIIPVGLKEEEIKDLVKKYGGVVLGER